MSQFHSLNRPTIPKSVHTITKCYMFLNFLYIISNILFYAIFLANIFSLGPVRVSGSSTSKMRQMLNDWDPPSALKSKGKHRIMRHDLFPSNLLIVSEIWFLFPLNCSAIPGQLWFHWLQGYLAMGVRCCLKSPSAQSTSPVCISHFFK